MDKVSVIIPTYNRPDLLARAIKSVQLQTLEDWELIVFSDHCPKAKDVYENFFKDDEKNTSLKNWNEFEIKYPDIFQGMYQFWIKKN